MPVFVNPADKWGSTLYTSGDTVHKRPNNAGNKSLISYRSDIGVPGYTGYIAAPQSVVLPVKTFEHTGKPLSDAAKETATASTLPGKLKVSEYSDVYHKKPSDTQNLNRSGGGYWITERKQGRSAPFIATTTYRAETLHGGQTADQQLQRSLGLPCTIPQYEAARQTAPRSASADPGLRRANASAGSGLSFRAATQRPATAVTSVGEVVGYQTTTESALLGAATMKAQATSRRPPVAPSTEMRYSVMPAAMPPSLYGAASAYTRDYGEDASDPMERSAPAEKFQTRTATTRELAAGTTRNTNNPPGYTGHIAASKYNHLGVAHSMAADERGSRQIDACLFGLDQYGRGRVPGYTGYKPQTARNQTSEQPSQGPTTITSSGAANAQATKHGVPPIDSTHYNNSREGLMTFFSATGEHVSDNGLSSAQEYYKVCRPSMMFSTSHLPHVTHYGKKFHARNSMV